MAISRKIKGVLIAAMLVSLSACVQYQDKFGNPVLGSLLTIYNYDGTQVLAGDLGGVDLSVDQSINYLDKRNQSGGVYVDGDQHDLRSHQLLFVSMSAGTPMFYGDFFEERPLGPEPGITAYIPRRLIQSDTADVRPPSATLFSPAHINPSTAAVSAEVRKYAIDNQLNETQILEFLHTVANEILQANASFDVTADGATDYNDMVMLSQARLRGVVNLNALPGLVYGVAEGLRYTPQYSSCCYLTNCVQLSPQSCATTAIGNRYIGNLACMPDNPCD